MKLAFVHQLPVEIYPPATNALAIYAAQSEVEVRLWTSANAKGLPTYVPENVVVVRPSFPGFHGSAASRFWGFLRWHWRVARDLARWRPDVVLSIEPHSALAVWFYFRLFGGTARLAIHHHEYYAPTDFLGVGSRTSRLCHYFEVKSLFERAEWVSQTNDSRLRLMRQDCAAVTQEKARIWPNYPPEDWKIRAAAARLAKGGGESPRVLRLVCVGSLSFEDTFVREVVEWVAARSAHVSLYLCGHNVRANVWDWIRSLGADNIEIEPRGCAYDALPELLPGFDVALVLYKGNTLNFTHNVPNKAVEALVCGLEVWYPQEMLAMKVFCEKHPALPLREMDFKQMPERVPGALARAILPQGVFLDSEHAMAPLLKQLAPGSSL